MQTFGAADPRQNQILAALPKEDYLLLASHIETVHTGVNQQLSIPGSRLPYVYFPLNSVLSLVISSTDGVAVEVAAVGNEGMLGLEAFLEDEIASQHAFVQVADSVSQIRVDDFKQVMAQSISLRRLMHRYSLALFNQVTQVIACHRLHSLQQRCARWLLTVSDQTRSEKFFLTQEFLAQMMGVRRASVNAIARELSNNGIISYQRGRMTILDRAALELMSCECYETIKDIHRRVFQTSNHSAAD